jgi:chemotaxis protein methyltransferase CheR
MEKQLKEKLKKIIYDKVGIHFSEEKNYLFESKIERLIQKEKFKSVDELYDLIKNGDRKTIETLIKYITTNHTFFFREEGHLDILVELIKKRNNKKSTIWCAASSTGEEVYSMIIKLLENNITNFLILASDINKKVLHHMHEGIYNSERFQNTPKYIKQKYFTKSGSDQFKISENLRNYFRIKQLNLIEYLEFEEDFDFIFCRNVLIYFDNDTKDKVIHNLLHNLKKFGYLFIGHTETLLNSPEKINRVSNSVYQKMGD